MKKASTWKNILSQRLPLLGHRNWIVIADSAYPWQTSSGIETVDTQEDHLTVINYTLRAITSAHHVRPLLYTDAELPHLPETHASGIKTLRNKMQMLLAGSNVKSLPHEQIIYKLDEAGQAFRILVLKTTLTLPYTSLFIQLDCGYWSEEAESALRKSMKSLLSKK